MTLQTILLWPRDAERFFYRFFDGLYDVAPPCLGAFEHFGRLAGHGGTMIQLGNNLNAEKKRFALQSMPLY